MKKSIGDRILSRIEKTDADCWIWQGAKQSNGYGSIGNGHGKTVLVHRASYEAFVGPIPDGLTLDHTCHTNSTDCPGGKTCMHRLCANPAHLEPVTADENRSRGLSPTAVNARRTHCKHGHELTETNTIRKANGRRNCRTCQYRMARVWRERVAEERAA